MTTEGKRNSGGGYPASIKITGVPRENSSVTFHIAVGRLPDQRTGRIPYGTVYDRKRRLERLWRFFWRRRRIRSAAPSI
jgi:hypothetical protein